MLDPSVSASVNIQYLDYLADDRSLTGTRTTEAGPRIDGTVIPCPSITSQSKTDSSGRFALKLCAFNQSRLKILDM